MTSRWDDTRAACDGRAWSAAALPCRALHWRDADEATRRARAGGVGTARGAAPGKTSREEPITEQGQCGGEAGRDRESEVARNAALAAMAAATSCPSLPRPSDGGAPRWFGLRWTGFEMLLG